MSPQLSLIILVVLLVVGWFALGTHINVRKGEDTLRWLQAGLPLVGEKTTLRWLGSSALELKIHNAKPPFREAEVMVLLEPRDVPLIWWYSRLRGRRDLFFFRGTLRSAPRHDLEALDPTAWSARGILREVQKRNWSAVSVAPPLVALSPQPSSDASRAIAATSLHGCPLVRLSLRRDEPNFEVQWRLRDVRQHPAGEVIECIRRALERV